MCFCWNKKKDNIIGEECVICFEEITKENKGYSTLCCGNHYHNKCITDWLNKNNTCPTCREIAIKKIRIDRNSFIILEKDVFKVINILNDQVLALIPYNDIKNLHIVHDVSGHHGRVSICNLLVELNDNWGNVTYKIKTTSKNIKLIHGTINKLK